MPYEAPAARHHVAAATKAVTHGDPAIEDGFAGIAAKSDQLTRFVDPSTTGATQVAIGQPFEIMLGRVHEVRAAKLTGGIGGFTVGTPVFIISATNVLDTSSNSGANPKFGRVDEVDTARGVVRINLDAKDSF